jgi:diadenosine tetraphosphatase ApaH/serine/threonine PP2A family protein phosphatase
MQPIAVLYDVHGNLLALKAVLSDIRGADVGGYVLGGDYALFGPSPFETVDRLWGLKDAFWIRGNGERWTALPGQAPANAIVQGAIAVARDELGEELVDQLAALPEQALLLDNVRFCHASPVSDVRAFLPEPGGDERELLAGVGEQRLVFGHTHVPFIRESDGIELINPGSVGMPFDGDPRAAYAILHPGGAVEHRRVPYDHEASARGVIERFGESEWTQTIARRISTAHI